MGFGQLYTRYFKVVLPAPSTTSSCPYFELSVSSDINKPTRVSLSYVEGFALSSSVTDPCQTKSFALPSVCITSGEATVSAFSSNFLHKYNLSKAFIESHFVFSHQESCSDCFFTASSTFNRKCETGRVLCSSVQSLFWWKSRFSNRNVVCVDEKFQHIVIYCSDFVSHDDRCLKSPSEFQNSFSCPQSHVQWYAVALHVSFVFVWRTFSLLMSASCNLFWTCSACGSFTILDARYRCSNIDR